MEEHQEQFYIYLDIETKSHGVPDFESLRTLDEIKQDYPTKEELVSLVPKTYQKNDKSISEWIDKNYTANIKKAEEAYEKQVAEYDKEFRKKALNSLEADLVCIGITVNDEEPYMIGYQEDEAEMLKDLVEYIDDKLGHRKHIAKWVGQRVLGFDILFLWHRAIKYQNKDLLSILPVEKWSKRIEDINDMFNAGVYGKYNSLNDICVFLGIPGKGDVDGSMIHDLFLANKFDEIYDYCGNGDVRKTRMVHRMLKCLPQLETDLENVK